MIGVAFDGLGYGTDGTLWGGELLVADLAGFTRAGHLAAGAAARRHGGDPRTVADGGRAGSTRRTTARRPTTSTLLRRHAHHWDAVARCPRRPVDAGARPAPAGCSTRSPRSPASATPVNYEGQAAIELEQRADLARRGAYPLPVTGDPPYLDATATIRAVVDDMRGGVAGAGRRRTLPQRSRRAATVEVCDVARRASGLDAVACPAACSRTRCCSTRGRRLVARGFRVLVHSRVPPNDGGISLGQVAVAASAATAGRGQQIRGSGSPTSMSTIRVPPNAVLSSTSPGGSSCTRPMTAAPAPSGCAADRVERERGASPRYDGDEPPLTRDVERVDAEQLARTGDHGPHRARRSRRRRPRRREAAATSLRIVATPPRVASRSNRTSGTASSRVRRDARRGGGVGRRCRPRGRGHRARAGSSRRGHRSAR